MGRVRSVALAEPLNDKKAEMKLDAKNNLTGAFMLLPFGKPLLVMDSFVNLAKQLVAQDQSSLR
jgi:hypothetical protein